MLGSVSYCTEDLHISSSCYWRLAEPAAEQAVWRSTICFNTDLLLVIIQKGSFPGKKTHNTVRILFPEVESKVLLWILFHITCSIKYHIYQ